MNSDLIAKVKEARINASRVAEEALARALAEHAAAALEGEIAQDLRAFNAYVAEHGSFAEMAREHYAAEVSDDGDAEAV
jgi:post-segregation antitoxin (ccd killing protein)